MIFWLEHTVKSHTHTHSKTHTYIHSDTHTHTHTHFHTHTDTHTPNHDLFPLFIDPLHLSLSPNPFINPASQRGVHFFFSRTQLVFLPPLTMQLQKDSGAPAKTCKFQSPCPPPSCSVSLLLLLFPSYSPGEGRCLLQGEGRCGRGTTGVSLSRSYFTPNGLKREKRGELASGKKK